MPSIAIIGGGPAGLTLARLLQVQHISHLDIHVFERDASPAARKYQGGTLDLHPDTGLAAIKAMGLWEEFVKYARYEGEEMIIADKNATAVVHMKETPKIGSSYARPEIDREKLKDILLRSFGQHNVTWGKTLKSVDSVSGQLTFADGTAAGPFDLVVGADGAWSKVRPILSDHRPAYSGVCGLEATVDKISAGENWESISKMVGQGSYFSYGDLKSLMAQRMGDGSLKISAWLKKDESWPAQVLKENGGDEGKVKAVLLQEYPDWSRGQRSWIQNCNTFRPWPLYELPVGHNWEHKRGYTLIGDSAHLMTPFAGEGVNAAMKDALELSRFVTEAVKDSKMSLDEAVAGFEREMFPRTTKVQDDTAFNKRTMFREDAPVGFVVETIGRIAAESGYDLDKSWQSWIPVKKIASCYLYAVLRFGMLRRYLAGDVAGKS